MHTPATACVRPADRLPQPLTCLMLLVTCFDCMTSCSWSGGPQSADPMWSVFPSYSSSWRISSVALSARAHAPALPPFRSMFAALPKCSVLHVIRTHKTTRPQTLPNAGIKAPRGLHKRARTSLAASAIATPDSAALAAGAAARGLPAQGSAPLPARPSPLGGGSGDTPGGDPGAAHGAGYRSQSLPAALHAAARPTPTLAGVHDPFFL